LDVVLFGTPRSIDQKGRSDQGNLLNHERHKIRKKGFYRRKRRKLRFRHHVKRGKELTEFSPAFEDENDDEEEDDWQFQAG
jgi:hypothetical protein